MWKLNNIRRRVLPIVEGKIVLAQKQYDEELKAIDESTATSIRILTEQAEQSKTRLEDTLVEGLINKLI